MDPQGNRYQVRADSILPPGWSESGPPTSGNAGNLALHPPVSYADEAPSSPAVGPGQPLPPVQPNPYLAQQPQAPPAPAVPQYNAQPQQPTSTVPTYTSAQPPVQQQPQQSQGLTPGQSTFTPTNPLPPGKKALRHQSGYIVYVDQSTTPGPEFTEVQVAPTAPAAPQMYGQAAPSPYGQAPAYGAMPPQQPAPNPMLGGAQLPGGAGPITYQQLVTQGQQQNPVNTYQGQPQSYANQPQVSHLPPTWQQQLPYQPSQPQTQAPLAPGNNPYMMGGQPQQPVPIVRGTPPGKKWVADQSGLRYLVDQNTVIGGGMRELTPEEVNGPVQMMAPQQLQQQQMMMQQQQQQGGGGIGSAIGRFFGGLGR
jgi:hypothetical protein